MTMEPGTDLPLPPANLKESFLIGWLCAESGEFYEARKMLEKEYSSKGIVKGIADQNEYHLGRIGKHYVVMNRPPISVGGESQAGKLAANMKSTFPWLRFILLVGTGGTSSPTKHNDIRLGDVVFGLGVHPYTQGTPIENGPAAATRTLQPPDPLLAATTLLKTGDRSNIPLDEVEEYLPPNDDFARRPSQDNLYESDYSCKGDDCHCNQPQEQEAQEQEAQEQETSYLADRPLPKHRNNIMIHTGIVGSADRPLRSGTDRNAYSERHDIICFETGAAQVMEIFPCLPIRGISDYSDGHKSDNWKPYASLVAAICAKHLLGHLNTEEVVRYPYDWSFDQIQQYVKGATNNLNHTIGQFNKSNGNIDDSERTVNALIERHELLFNLANAFLPRMKKEVVKKDMEEGLGATKTREFHDLMRSVEEMQGEMKTSLDDLKKKVLKHGKEPKGHHRGKGNPSKWENLRDQLDHEINVAEKLSWKIHQSLLTMERCLPPETDGRKHNETQRIWKAMTVLFDEFKYSIEIIPARIGRKLRGFRHQGRQKRNRSITNEHQNREELATTEIPRYSNTIPDSDYDAPENGRFGDYLDTVSAPSLMSSDYQRPQQSIPTERGTIHTKQSEMSIRGRSLATQIHDSVLTSREPPPVSLRDAAHSPVRSGNRSTPNLLSPVGSGPDDQFSQPEAEASSSSSLSLSSVPKPSPAQPQPSPVRGGTIQAN